VNADPGEGYRRHGHAAETIGLAAVAALGLEAVLPAAGAPGWVLPASEIVASAGSAFVTWSFTGRKVFPIYMAALGSFLGAWTAWAGSDPWHGSVLGAWLAGLAVLIPWGVAAWHKRNGRPQAPAFPALTAVPEPLMIEPEPDPNDLERALFAVMFADYGISAGEDPVAGGPVPVDVYSLTEDKAGRTVRVRLPVSGRVTIGDFRAKARNFEVALNVQEGAVTFESGDNSRDVVMKVRERNGLADSMSLTPELRAQTVNDEFVIGVQEDGSYLKVTVRESHFMIIGIMGSGKSNLLNVLVAQLASMVDTVIWMVDMKGGRAAKPWFQAWSEGRAEAPPIDWLATTREEAALMMAALRTGVDARSRSGIGGNKIIPSAGRPQVVFICDEMADLFGDSTAPTRAELGDDAKNNNSFVKDGTWMTQHARSEAFTTMWASQRGTNGMSGSGDMKANIDVSIALKPKKYADLQYIIPDAPDMAGRQLQLLAETPGVGMLGRGAKVSQITKFLHHDHIEGACGTDDNEPRCPAECPVYQTQLEVGPVRPRLDALTASAMGTGYAQRWMRAARDGILKVPARALAGGSASYRYSDGDASRFDEVVKGIEDPERDLDPQWVRVRSYLARQGVQGSSVRRMHSMLIEEFGDEAVTRETVHRRLTRDLKAGLVHHPGYRRWVSGEGDSVPDDED
jgi:hypothetical protein